MYTRFSRVWVAIVSSNGLNAFALCARGLQFNSQIRPFLDRAAICKLLPCSTSTFSKLPSTRQSGGVDDVAQTGLVNSLYAST